MTKLTKAHRALLTTISEAADGAIPAPSNRKPFEALVKCGHLTLVSKGKGPRRLVITESGREVIGPAPAAVEDAPANAAPKGKLGLLVNLLRRPDGASIEDMTTATGWQAHSVRGAISGSLKKAMGLAVTSDKTEAGRTYRIVEAAVA